LPFGSRHGQQEMFAPDAPLGCAAIPSRHSDGTVHWNGQVDKVTGGTGASCAVSRRDYQVFRDLWATTTLVSWHNPLRGAVGKTDVLLR
jgi:hypothetical protein